MNLDVMISYLPLYRDALFLTMRVGWKGVAIAVLIGLIGSAIIHFEIPIARYIVSAYTQNVTMQKDYYFAVCRYNVEFAGLVAKMGLSIQQYNSYFK